jgi:molybdate transport system ATP-binding protein
MTTRSQIVDVDARETPPGRSVAGEPGVERTLAARFQKRLGAREPGADFLLQVDFTAAAGFTILFGPSGAGKTMLLDCIAGLSRPDEGKISVGGRVLFARDEADIPAAKRRVGYVFQDLALFPHLTVEENVRYGLAHLPAAERRSRAGWILGALRIAQFAQRKPRELSGGEKQRAALARTLATDPEVLLLDEPLAALDATTKSKIIDDLRAWNEAHGIPILYVTHSRDEVYALGERAIVLESGRMVAQGTPHEVLDAPRQESIAHLAGFENVFDAKVRSLHEDRGTMMCVLAGTTGSAVLLETPLIRAEVGGALRVGIRAGDILLANAAPVGLSARNIIPGHITLLERRDVMISARVDCGVEMEVHLTLAARDSLDLIPGRAVWLVIKTHSCHLMQKSLSS